MIAHPKSVRISYANSSAHDIVYGDPARLRQLFMVLLDNAVRYSSAKGEVKVAIASDNGEVRVSVVDQGIGIAPEELGSYGRAAISWIEGDYLNVVGLPATLLVRLLAQRFAGLYGYG